MKLIPINYQDGQIWVDNKHINGHTDNIKKGELFVSFKLLNPNEIEGIHKYGEYANDNADRRIIAQSTNLSLPDISYIEIEEDVKQLAETSATCGYQFPQKGATYLAGVRCFKEGYKAASAKKYTEEDVRKAFEAGMEFGTSLMNIYPNEDEFIQSLQPKVVSIEIETVLEYLIKKTWKQVLLPSEWSDGNLKREIPITYQKDGKVFLKVKSVQYDK